MGSDPFDALTPNITQMAKSVSKASSDSITVGGFGTDTLENHFGGPNSFGVDLSLDFTIRTSKTDVEGKSFSFDVTTKSITDVVKEINDANIGVKASYDASIDRFFFNTESTGEENGFQIISDADNFLSDATGAGTNKLKLKIKTIDVSDRFSTGDVSANLTDNLKTLYPTLGDNISFSIETHKGTFDFNVDTNNATLQDIIDYLNDEKTGLDAGFDEATGKFFLSAKGNDDTVDPGDSTLSNSFFKVTADSDNFLSGPNGGPGDGTDNVLKMKLIRDGNNVNVENYNGTNMKFDFGDATDIEKTSNSFTVNGINITAKQIGNTTVKIDTNVDSVYDKIKSFVDKYNELITTVNEKLDEKFYRDFPPLTDQQREELKDSEIELWDEKSKSGLLRDDTILSDVLSDVRQSLYGSVYSSYDADDASNTSKISGYSQLTAIGITTGTYAEKGKLIIDEQKLKTAISENVDSVLELFFKAPSDAVNKDDKDLIDDAPDEETGQKLVEQKYNESGIFNRMFNTLVNGMKDIVNKAGPGEDAALMRDIKSNMLIDFVTKKGSISLLDKEIDDYKLIIFRQEESLMSIEEGYWRKFSAMEAAMSRMNQQSAWLAQQLG